MELEASRAVQAAQDRIERIGADLQAMKLIANRDALTGLLNRRAFLPLAKDALGDFRRVQRPLSVLMIDIDHFKRVNDRYGHPAGDVVIRKVGTIINDTIRTTDKVARFGGEEFVVLLNDNNAAGAAIIAERIRQTVASTVFEADNDRLLATISIGIAEAEKFDTDIDRIIERADRALYEAKSRGRNCVHTFEIDIDDLRSVA